MMDPEQVLERAEKVRQVYLTERKLQKLEVKVQHGHLNLEPFRDQLVAKLKTTIGGAG